MNLIPTHGINKKSTRAERIYMEFLDYSELEQGGTSTSFHWTNIGVGVGNLFMLVAEPSKGRRRGKEQKREKERERKRRGKREKKKKYIIMSIIIISV